MTEDTRDEALKLVRSAKAQCERVIQAVEDRENGFAPEAIGRLIGEYHRTLACWRYIEELLTREKAPSALDALIGAGVEFYWCGCARHARWQRCPEHADLDHDEEPEPARQEETS